MKRPDPPFLEATAPSRRWPLDSRPLLLRALIVALGVWGPLFCLVLFYQGLRAQAYSILAGLVVLGLAAWFQRGRESTVVAGNLVAGALFAAATALAVLAEGLLSPALDWYVLVPILATVLIGRKWGLLWAAVGVAALVAFFVAGDPVSRLAPETLEVLALWGKGGLVVFGLSFALLYDQFRRQAMEDLEEKNRALRRAIEEVRQLRGILPICMHCRKVRDEGSVWLALEEYLASHSELHFSHGLCDECLAKEYPELVANEIG